MNPDLTSITEALNRLVAASGKGAWDYVNTVAVLLTLGVLIWYTVETYRLRLAAQRQTEESGRLLQEAQRQNEASKNLVIEAKRQNEIAVMPMLAIVNEVLPNQTDRSIVLRSVGSGPAFNLSIDRARFGNGELRVDHDGNLTIVDEKTVLRVEFYDDQHSLTQLDVDTLYKWINTGRLPDPLAVIVRCCSVNSVEYAFTFNCATDGGQGKLKITFVGAVTV